MFDITEIEMGKFQHLCDDDDDDEQLDVQIQTISSFLSREKEQTDGFTRRSSGLGLLGKGGFIQANPDITTSPDTTFFLTSSNELTDLQMELYIHNMETILRVMDLKLLLLMDNHPGPTQKQTAGIKGAGCSHKAESLFFWM